MKNAKFLFTFLVLFILSMCVLGSKKGDIDKNKKVAEQYHELKADNVKSILCEDFIGRNEKSRHTWNAKQHEKYLSNGVFKKDSICNQVAEGEA